MVELSQTTIIFGLSLFIAILSFKPSEPYLSQYLICEKDSQIDYCSGYDNINACSENNPCAWSTSSLTCAITSCNNVSQIDCGNSNYDYCEIDGDSCIDVHCYKHFTNDQVNNEIYPWSTYAYLPFLLLLGLYAELFSYRMAILVGIIGRVITRFLLIYGTSMTSMQLMQVVYALGTAAEDVFAAYLYYILKPESYQLATSYIKAAALASYVLSGVLGDLLVVLDSSSINLLMWISAVAVCIGFFEGLVFIGSTRKDVINEKLKIMKRQLGILRIALYSRSLSAMLFLWILGNAVFTTLYDYEVAIYEELNGSNEWNGSVLAAMLVAGTVGALLPVWLHKDVSSITFRTHIDTNSSANRRVLMSLEDQEFQEPKMTENSLLSVVPEVIVAIRLIVMSVFSCVTLLFFIISWEVVASVCFLALFFFFWQYINVVVLARFALELKVIQLNTIYKTRNDDLNKTFSSTRNEHTGNFPNSHDFYLPQESDDYIDIPSEDTEEDKVMRNDGLDRPSFGRNSENIQIQTSEENEIDPPYSISFVIIIALSVVVQIILQSVMFNGLQLLLKEISWILVYIFITTTGFYILFFSFWFGLHELVHEVRKMLK